VRHLLAPEAPGLDAYLADSLPEGDFLDPDSGWEQLPAAGRCRLLFDGAADVDEIDVPLLGAKGATPRLLDRGTAQWSPNWAASRGGKPYPPVLGRFERGRGGFYGEDSGEDVRVRSGSAHVSAAGARWEPAFSVEGGETWVINWTMDLPQPTSRSHRVCAGITPARGSHRVLRPRPRRPGARRRG